MDYKLSNNHGFTIIELLIALTISGIVSAALITTFLSQQKSYVVQGHVAAMQQNLRGGMEMMTREIRLVGYDPDNVGGMGILDISPRDINDNIDITMNGNGAIQVAADFDDSGGSNASDFISFSIADSPIGTPDGKLDLTRNAGAGRQLLAENIEAMGFAFAYDADGDGNLDVSAGGNVIWAVDSDGDNALDLNLDTNDDGDIDSADGPAGGNGLITGTAIPNINVGNIRAVRIWLLARTDQRDPDYINGHTYVVGHKVISPNTDGDSTNDSYRMRLLTTTVKCRNLGL
ncbi:PilW family protein [Desulfobacter sp.]|uniref:PilW family protein n=1 Tax=Desulfobacter sp. TaxID=2294 RepID=UPI00257BEB12|nr:PilW family protein [Desulfobacter sp.]